MLKKLKFEPKSNRNVYIILSARSRMKIDREFLHEISSPLSALRIHLEMLIEGSRDHNKTPSLEALQKCQKLLDKCVVKIQEKKALIVESGEK